MKSKFVFLILFLGYVFIAIGDLIGFVTSGQEILFGLSLSALLMSLSDCITGLKIGLFQRNEMRYIAKCSSYFLEEKLKKKAFPTNQSVNMATEKIEIEYDANKVTFEILSSAISKAGYDLQEDVSYKNIDLKIGGMSCASCSKAVERVVKKTRWYTKYKCKFGN